MTRRRLPKNEALRGLNLYAFKVDGRNYYRYKHPETGKFHGMGYDRAVAIQAAKRLNERLIKAPDRVARVVGALTVTDAVEKFCDDFVAHREWAEKTRAEYKRMARAFGNAVRSGLELGRTQTTDVARFLDAKPAASSNRHRNTLLQFFRYCRSQGWIDWNPAEPTIAKVERVQRARLTAEWYDAIFAEATMPIQNAMRLSRKTLQARAEIARMKFQDAVGGKLKVIRYKTKEHSIQRAARGLEPSAFLSIAIDAELEKIIAGCRDDAVSAYLVHQPAKANKKRRTKGLSPESISRGFQRARDAVIEQRPALFVDKAGKPLKRDELPTFHEIRSLGADDLRGQGWPEERIQKLLAHTSVKMTQKYLEGHEIPWVEVSF